MDHIEHPDIAWMRKTGYPRDYEEPKEYTCPECGKEPDEYIYRDRHGDIIGCDRCITSQEYWEVTE